MGETSLLLGGAGESEEKSSEEMTEWEYVLKMNNGNKEQLKEAFKNDRTALGIFAALLMTVAFNAILLSPNEFDQSNQYIEYFAHANVFLNFLSGICALISVLVGSLQFMLLNRYPADRSLAVIEAMTEDNGCGPLDEPISWLWVSMLSMIAGATAGVYLMHGLPMFIMCCGTCLCLFPLAVMVVIRSGSQTRKVLDETFKEEHEKKAS